jgi:hypothetical protein
MRTLSKTILAAAAVALLASPALAQPFGGGFGGPPQGPQLLLNKSVQDELKLSDEVKGKLTKISEKRGADMRKAFQDAGMDREKMQEAMKTVTEETNKALTPILEKDLKPEQVKRFNQIKIQVAGIRAFTDPDVQKDLKLTDKQKQEAKAINEEVAKDSREIFMGAGFDREKLQEARKKVEGLTKEAMDRFTKTLSDDQKKTLKDLSGEKFELKLDPPRRPGGGN